LSLEIIGSEYLCWQEPSAKKILIENTCKPYSLKNVNTPKSVALTTNPGSAPADNCKLYGIYIPYILAQNEKQKIPHSLEYLHFSASTVYMCFLSGFSWQKVPVNINILNQWFLVTKLNSSFCKLNSRLHDLLTVMLCLCNIWPGML
jgi:hypothetical protein